jgi:hypothetical protein
MDASHSTAAAAAVPAVRSASQSTRVGSAPSTSHPGSKVPAQGLGVQAPTLTLVSSAARLYSAVQAATQVTALRVASQLAGQVQRGLVSVAVNSSSSVTAARPGTGSGKMCCSVCAAEFSTRESVRQHMEAKHRRFLCRGCNRHYDSPEARTAHEVAVNHGM